MYLAIIIILLLILIFCVIWRKSPENMHDSYNGWGNYRDKLRGRTGDWHARMGRVPGFGKYISSIPLWWQRAYPRYKVLENCDNDQRDNYDRYDRYDRYNRNDSYDRYNRNDRNRHTYRNDSRIRM